MQACVARRTRSRRDQPTADKPRAAVARVSQSLGAVPSELRKAAPRTELAAVTQPEAVAAPAPAPVTGAASAEAAAAPVTGAAAASPEDAPEAAADGGRRASCDSSSAYSHDRLESDALEAVLPSPRRSRARPRPKLDQFRLDAKCLKHFLSYLSPARLATCRGVSHDWRRVCSDDALWRPLVENFFPRGSAQLLRRLERVPRSAAYLRLYKLRLRLERAPDAFSQPRPDILRGYSVLVEIEVLRPDTGYSVVSDWRPLRRGDGRVLIDLHPSCVVPRADLLDLRLTLTLARHRDGRCCTVCYDAPFVTDPPRFDIRGPQGCLTLLGYRHAVACDDWEDAPRARFDSLSYSLLAPGALAMAPAHETHVTRLWDHLGSWFVIEDRV
jgi:hypothetical protein